MTRTLVVTATYHCNGCGLEVQGLDERGGSQLPADWKPIKVWGEPVLHLCPSCKLRGLGQNEAELGRRIEEEVRRIEQEKDPTFLPTEYRKLRRQGMLPAWITYRMVHTGGGD